MRVNVHQKGAGLFTIVCQTGLSVSWVTDFLIDRICQVLVTFERVAGFLIGVLPGSRIVLCTMGKVELPGEGLPLFETPIVVYHIIETGSNFSY